MLARLDWQPDQVKLDQFSQWGLFILGMVASPLALTRGHTSLAWAFWIAAVSLRGMALLRPMWLRPVYIGLTLLTWPIGWVVSYLTLGAIYFLVFTPVAVFFRLIGRDPLARRLEPGQQSYWEAYQPNQGRGRYLRQF